MKPGDYPLGSRQSRAAARYALKSRESAEPSGILVQLVRVGGTPNAEQKCTCSTLALVPLQSAGAYFEAWLFPAIFQSVTGCGPCTAYPKTERLRAPRSNHLQSFGVSSRNAMALRREGAQSGTRHINSPRSDLRYGSTGSGRLF